jgi:RecJ-like exonuclease
MSTNMNDGSPLTPFTPGGLPARRAAQKQPAWKAIGKGLLKDWDLSGRDAKQRKQHQAEWRGMQPKPAMVCPHCQVKGRVQTREVRAKKGISGGKATAAVLTAGVSMLATGLSRKEVVTEARCANCDSYWTF